MVGLCRNAGGGVMIIHLKKIHLQSFGYFPEHFTVNASAFEYVANIAAVTINLLGKPSLLASLAV